MMLQRLSSILRNSSSLRRSILQANNPTLINRISPLSSSEWQFPISKGLATSRRAATSPRQYKKIDIGARARQKQARRLWRYGLTFAGFAGFVVIVLSNYQEYLVFYVTPTEAMEQFRQNPSKNKFRLGGLVLEGSLVQPASTTEMEFVVTDLVTDVLVRYKGALPDLFREGHSAVVEGTLKPLDRNNMQILSEGRAASEKAVKSSCYFSAFEVLAKHDEKYMPKEVAAAIERNRAAINAAHAAAGKDDRSSS